MTLPDPKEEITRRVNELLDQLGVGGVGFRSVGLSLVDGDGMTTGTMVLSVDGVVDVQAFLALWQPPKPDDQHSPAA